MRKHKLKKTIEHIIHDNVTPNQIALGFTLGLALSIIPTFGIGMIVALVLAWLLDYHLIATYLGTLVVNPFTAPAVYLFDYSIGASILGAPSVSEFAFSLHTLGNIAVELYLGSLIVAAVACGISYLVVFELVYYYRKQVKKDV